MHCPALPDLKHAASSDFRGDVVTAFPELLSAVDISDGLLVHPDQVFERALCVRALDLEEGHGPKIIPPFLLSRRADVITKM